MIDFLDKRWGRRPRSAAKSLSNFQFLFFLLLCFGHIDLVISQTEEAESASLQASQATVAVDSDAETQSQTYQRNYFNQYNPQTAWDIIDRLPGFTLDSGEDLRGFGATAGNVLIDGERPSSKTGGIVGALNRIPANLIERVEVIRGVAGNSEAAGQAVVANLIQIADATLAGWESKIEQADDSTIYGSSELTWAQPSRHRTRAKDSSQTFSGTAISLRRRL